MPIPRYYWDTSCFISYLSAHHPDEEQRALICKDVLLHAQNDRVEIWTSAWTIVETIRPKQKFQPAELPGWAKALDQIDEKGVLLYPDGKQHLSQIWDHYTRHTMPTRKLKPEEVSVIRSLFSYPFIKIIQIEPSIANHASQIALDLNMRPGDSLHVASAVARKCDCLHRWDRDFTKSNDLIHSCEPVMISPQGSLYLASGEQSG